ncbi:MAG: hypothetical protein EBQ99_03150 [Planctomycetes bacterium]|nr:hypothetical protein [Planctomycetota bacterium]
MRHLARPCLTACVLALAACYSVQWPWTTTELTTSGLADNPVKVSTAPAEAWYMIEPAQISFYSSDIPADQLAGGGKLSGQVVNIQLLWDPKPGLTPLEPTTTNISIRLVVFAEGEVGVYGGGGFAWPRGKAEDGSMGLLLTGSNLSLVARTKGFVDLLSPAEMLGTVTARMDEAQSRALRRAASQAVTNALGQVKWVARPAHEPVAMHAR